jgi:GH43 family beta-xylosidase
MREVLAACRRGIGVWATKAKRLHELGQGLAVKVGTPPPNTGYFKELWAPELHCLRGKWRIYIAPMSDPWTIKLFDN